jgi:hypothetical protein
MHDQLLKHADPPISPKEALLLKRYRLLRPTEQQLIQELLEKYAAIGLKGPAARSENRVRRRVDS